MGSWRLANHIKDRLNDSEPTNDSKSSNSYEGRINRHLQSKYSPNYPPSLLKSINEKTEKERKTKLMAFAQPAASTRRPSCLPASRTAE